MSAPLFGRFLEVALSSEDLPGSFAFYERLGFRSCPTGDAWPHRYAVLGDGQVHLGLHESALDSPVLSFVLPELVRARTRLLAAGLTPESEQLGEEALNCLQLRDPGGHVVLLQEARTFSPGAGASQSLCGRFLHLSLPQPDIALARLFWESGGLVALPEESLPYPHIPLAGDQLALAFHAPAFCRAPLLVFEHPEPARLRQAAQQSPPPLQPSPLRVPGRRLSGLNADYCLIEAPEGTLLLSIESTDH
jgi:hypothetical protein